MYGVLRQGAGEFVGRRRACDAELPHVTRIEQAGGGAAVAMFAEDAFVLDGKLPAGEIDHAAAGLDVLFVQRCNVGLGH